MCQSPVPRKAPLTFSVSSLPLQAHVCVWVCMQRLTEHTHTHTLSCPRGLCDMLYLIFIPSLSLLALKVPLCLSAHLLPWLSSWSSTFLQNEQLPRSGLLLGRVLEGCQPPDLT